MATEIAARNLVTTQIRRALHHLTRIDGFSAALGGVVSQGGARLVLSELHNMRCELLRGIVVAPGIGRVGRILQEQAHRARGDLAPLTGRDVAELNAELVAVAAAVSDPDLRDRLVALSDRLSGGGAAKAARSMIRLSRREADVLIQLAAGCTNQEIADRLSILPTTVKTHLRNAMRKLGARNRVEAVSAARHAGLVR